MGLRLGVVIPAHNEAKNIAGIVGALRKFPEIVRLLVVDGGSSDGTGERAQQAGAEVLRLESREARGKGRVLRAGIGHLKSEALDYYAFLDGDGQHDPEDLAAFLAMLKEDPGLDFLIGSRKHQSHLIPKKRWNTNVLGSWTLGRIAGVKWEDTQSGFRLVKKSLLDRLPLGSRGFAIEMEMAMRAAHYKIRWAHVPIQVIYHAGCPSHFKGFSDVVKIMFYSLLC